MTRAPATRGELERAKADAEHGYREAQRQEERARGELAEAISSEAPVLVREVNVEERAASAPLCSDGCALELDALEDEAGTVRTIATIGEERTRARGFESVRSRADRFDAPEAHLAGLREIRSPSSPRHR